MTGPCKTPDASDFLLEAKDPPENGAGRNEGAGGRVISALS